MQLGQWAEAGIDPRSCALIYVAHSLPESLIRKGDPYETLTRTTVAAVHRKVRNTLAAKGLEPWLDNLLSHREVPLAFQSKVGPVKWLGPYIDLETKRLAADGCRCLMVQPVSFTCEHIETIVELDIELQATARVAGITDFRRGGALNLEREWLESMAAELASRAFKVEVKPHV